MNIVLLIKDFAVGKKFDKSGMPNQNGGERHGLNHARELYDDCIDLVRLHGGVRWLEIIIRLMTTHRHTDAYYIIGRPKFAVWAVF